MLEYGPPPLFQLVLSVISWHTCHLFTGHKALSHSGQIPGSTRGWKQIALHPRKFSILCQPDINTEIGVAPRFVSTLLWYKVEIFQPRLKIVCSSSVKRHGLNTGLKKLDLPQVGYSVTRPTCMQAYEIIFTVRPTLQIHVHVHLLLWGGGKARETTVKFKHLKFRRA